MTITYKMKKYINDISLTKSRTSKRLTGPSFVKDINAGAAKLITLLLVLFFSGAGRSYGQVIDSTTTTNSSCANNGSLTVYASGGIAPLSYQVISGPVTTSLQSSNIFGSLPPGTYAARIVDNAGSADTTSGIVISGSYTVMNPTATATNEICPGSNTGSITLGMPSGQGTPPYTYTIESGPTSAIPVNNNLVSYTFQNLSPGSYSVRVTDACNSFQTRQATLAAANPYTLSLYVTARPSVCGSMDYYLQPGLGTNYPHTLYSYKPDGSLAATITVTAADLVTIPGTALSGFKFTLPNPPTFFGTYYTFKYTDACVTNTNSPLVIPNTPALGQYQLSTTSINCQLALQTKLLEGWGMPVNVSITSASNGSTQTQQIADETTRTTVFDSLQAGSYNVTITDTCGHTITTTYNLQPQALGKTISNTCGGNIPGTGSIDISNLEQGWQTPVTATITSGPTSYYNAFMNQTFTATYPASAQPMINNIIRFTNMAPGSYNIVLSDGCNTDTVNFTAVAPGAVYNIPQEIISGCAGSRKITGNSSSSCTQPFSVDVKKGVSEATYANGISAGNGFTLSNVPPDVYSIYYYSIISTFRTSVFNIPASNIYNGNFLVKKDTTTVTPSSTNPALSGVQSVSCAGSVNIKMIPDSTKGTRPYTFEIISGPGGYTSPPQTNPELYNLSMGTYAIRIADSCGNSNVQSFSVSGMTPASIQSINPCVGQNETLSHISSPYYHYYWIKPGGVSDTSATLSFTPVTASDTGTYQLVTKATIGSCTDSSIASLAITNCSPLPVSLLSFTAQQYGNNKSLLIWTTASEQRNKGFSVEHSPDGSSWNTAGFVNSKAEQGNSNVKLDYRFTDNAPGKGNNYYRLKQVDMDGAYVYSPVRIVQFNRKGNPVAVYPNPATRDVTISGLTGDEEIVLYNIHGQRIQSIDASGSAMTLDISRQPSGIYLLSIMDRSGSVLNKVKIVKQ